MGYTASDTRPLHYPWIVYCWGTNSGKTCKNRTAISAAARYVLYLRIPADFDFIALLALLFTNKQLSYL